MLTAQKTIVPVAALVLLAFLILAIMINTAMFMDSANGIWHI